MLCRSALIIFEGNRKARAGSKIKIEEIRLEKMEIQIFSKVLSQNSNPEFSELCCRLKKRAVAASSRRRPK